MESEPVRHPHPRSELHRLARPANPDGHASFRFFLEELAFFQITQPQRRLVYSFVNGVCAAEVDAALADRILAALGPGRLLFAYLDAVEHAYTAGLDPAQEGRLEEQVRAFTQAHGAARQRLLASAGRGGVEPDLDCWCALSFCAGVVGRQRKAFAARHIVRRYRMRLDRMEPYLFTMVARHAAGADCFRLGHPMSRFIAGCYPDTPVEREYMPLLFARLSDELDTGDPDAAARGLFVATLAVGLRTACSDRVMLGRLLAEADADGGPDSLPGIARLFKRNTGREDFDGCPVDELLLGCNRHLASAYPHLNPNTEGCTRPLHVLSYIYGLFDTAFWLGLYIGCPQGFEDYQAWRAG